MGQNMKAMNDYRYITADEAVKMVKSGDHVFVQGSSSIPEALVAALARRGGELRDVILYNAFAMGRRISPLCDPSLKDSFLIDSFFVSNAVRGWVNQGYATTTPRSGAAAFPRRDNQTRCGVHQLFDARRKRICLMWRIV